MHPDDVLEQLKLSASTRKAKNLDIVHAVCREQCERGSKDFSVATISKYAQLRGGPVTSTIHNKTGDDFKGLIKSWADHTGGVQRKPRKVNDSPILAVLDKILDPAVRAVMGAVLAENRQFRAEVALLKAHSEVIVDLRESRSVARGTIQVLPAMAGMLSEVERDALQHAISEIKMREEGWSVDEYGRILNDKRRHIFKVGFASAIRKIINAT